MISVMPMIQEANAIAEELEKPIAFEIFVISPQTFGMKDGKPEVSAHKLENFTIYVRTSSILTFVQI